MPSFVRISVLTWADILAAYPLFVMMTYLTNVWRLNLTHAAAVINIWVGLAFVMQIWFAFLVDTFMGNFAMLVVSSIAYSVGLGFLAMSTPPVLSKTTGNCSAYKPECIGDTQKALFYTALALIAVGISGHLVSLNSFLTKQTADQEDQKKDGPWKRLWQCAAIFPLFFVPVIGGVALPFIKPWSIRFGIPAICTLVATLLFLSGSCSCSYSPDKPKGSPLTTVFRVCVASAYKTIHQCPQNASVLYKGCDQPSVSLSNGLRFLNKAAIVLPKPTKEEQERNRWILCSVSEVEEAKIGIRMVPMCMTFIIFGLVISIGKTYFIEQANHMNRKLGHLTVPLPLFLIFYEFAKPMFTSVYFSMGCFFRGLGLKSYGPPTGIAVAMVFSVLCCITAAKVETRRHNVIRSHDLLEKPGKKIPMSMMWLLPQYMLLGAVEGISEKIIAKFFEDQAPPSMRCYLKFFADGLFGLGIMASVLFTYIVGKVSEMGGKPNWFQDTLNRSHLYNYYWTLAAFSTVILVLYIVVAVFYPYRESESKDGEA